MRMERSEGDALLVWLSEQDACQMGLPDCTQEDIPVITRRFLRNVLEQARQQMGFVQTNGLQVEILQMGKEFLLIFTPTDTHPAKRPGRVGDPMLYFLPCTDSLLQLAAGLPQRQDMPFASLYRTDKEFCLLLYERPDTVLARLLREVAVRIGEGVAAAAYIEEYAKAYCIGDALSRLQITEPE